MDAIITITHLNCDLGTIKEGVSKGAIPCRTLQSVYLDGGNPDYTPEIEEMIRPIVNKKGVTIREEWIYNTDNIMNKHSCIVFLKGRFDIEEEG